MKYMRIQLYVPRALFVANRLLQDELMKRFNGLTHAWGTGVFKHTDGTLEQEPVTIYTVFAEDTDDNRMFIEQLALDYKEMSGETSVLYVLNENDVHFV